jgi:hypothetical protein
MIIKKQASRVTSKGARTRERNLAVVSTATVPPHVTCDGIARSECSQYETTCHVLSAMRFLTRPMESIEARHRGNRRPGGKGGTGWVGGNTRSSSVTSQIERGFAATAESYRKSMRVYSAVSAGHIMHVST